MSLQFNHFDSTYPSKPTKVNVKLSYNLEEFTIWVSVLLSTEVINWEPSGCCRLE